MMLSVIGAIRQNSIEGLKLRFLNCFFIIKISSISNSKIKYNEENMPKKESNDKFKFKDKNNKGMNYNKI